MEVLVAGSKKSGMETSYLPIENLLGLALLQGSAWVVLLGGSTFFFGFLFFNVKKITKWMNLILLISVFE